MKVSRHTLILSVVAIVLLPLMLGAKKSRTANTPPPVLAPLQNPATKMDKEVSEADRAKAEYIYLEAQNYKRKDEIDKYFELLRHAHSIDPTNTAINSALGLAVLLFEQGSGEYANLGYDLMRTHYDAHPDDIFSTSTFGSIARRMGRDSVALEVFTTLSKYYPTDPDVQFNLADAYAQVGDFANALSAYDSLQTNVGINADITRRKVNVYAVLNDTANAIREVHQLLRTAPTSAINNIFTSNVMQHFALYDSALYYLDQAELYNPGDGYVHLAKSEYFDIMNDSVNYDAQTYKALTSESLDLGDKLQLLYTYSAKLLRNKQDYKRAETLFDVLVAEHPHEGAIRELYAQYLSTDKRYTKAAEQMAYATDADPSNVSYWKMRIALLEYANNHEEAANACRTAIGLHPLDTEFYRYLGSCLYQLKRYSEAIAVYDQALEICGENNTDERSTIMGIKADAIYMSGDADSAFVMYEAALKLNPGNVMLSNNYAYFLAQSGKDLDRAESLSALTVKSEPENATYLDTYAWIFFIKGEYKMALMYIESAFQYEPDTDSEEMWEHYGDILFMNQRFDEAVTKWEKALEFAPDKELLQRKVTNKTYFPK